MTDYASAFAATMKAEGGGFCLFKNNFDALHMPYSHLTDSNLADDLWAIRLVGD